MLNFVIIFGAKYLYLLVILIALIYILSQSKNRRKEILILIAVSFPLIYITAKLTSLFYFDPRPFVVGHFVPLIPHAPDNGFPSDHALLTSAVASIVYFLNKKVSILLWILTFMVGAARVLASVHHWVDIFGAIVIAIIITKFVVLILLQTKLFAYRD